MKRAADHVSVASLLAEATERYINLLPSLGNADRCVAGLRPGATKALGRLSYTAQMRLLHVLVKSILFIRPHDRSADEMAEMIATFARAAAAEEGRNA